MVEVKAGESGNENADQDWYSAAAGQVHTKQAYHGLVDHPGLEYGFVESEAN